MCLNILDGERGFFCTSRMLILLGVFVALLHASTSETIEVPDFKQRRIVCYYTFPSTSDNLQPKDIDYSLCTHIIVGFVTLQNSSIYISRSEKEIVRNIVERKKQYPNLKILLSIGGGGGDYGFPQMVRNSTNRAKFIESTETIINRMNLDGIDLDWEFPSNVMKNDKGHLIEVLQDLRLSINNSVRKYISSVAVAAPITLIAVSYDIPKMNSLVDFINVMSYDYNFFSYLTPWTGINAPLYARSADVFYFTTQNINFTSRYYVKRGMDKEKINIGLPVYAHTYTLAYPNSTQLGAPAIGNGRLGAGGSAYYGVICDFMKQQKLVPVFDDETKSPYVTNGSEWVSFDNKRSMKYKAKYVYDNEYGGVMVFSLNSDDYQGKCTDGEYFPNTRVIHDIFTQGN